MPTWLWWFLLGALLAWLIEWVIDWQYWRARLKRTLTVWDSSSSMRNRLLSDPTTRRGSLSHAGSAQADEVAQVRAALVAAQQLLQQREAELSTLQDALNEANADLQQRQAQDGSISAAEAEQLRARISELEAQLAQQPPSRDTFTAINGIGPAFQQRLYDAGVCTFADLARQTPERLRQIVRPTSKQRIKPEAWIAEAQRRAQSHAREQSA